MLLIILPNNFIKIIFGYNKYETASYIRESIKQ